MRLHPFFNEDGDIGGGYAPEAVETAPEPSSVVTEDYESLGDGNAPEPAETGAQPTEDVTKQQSFANRLREEKERAIAEERAKWEREQQAELAYLDKVAQMNGFRDREEYKRALDAHLQQQQMEQEAHRMGLDLETYQQFFQPVNTELQQLKTEVEAFREMYQQQETKAQQAAKWSALYNEFPALAESASAFHEGKDPEWYNDGMKGYIDRGYDPVDAYRLAHASTIARQQEQETLARITGRDERQVLSSTDSPHNMQLNPADMSPEDIERISERVRRGERITF
ncbi:hypothetical protein DNH61_11765 [Paenibacillus sambharensis]|uniref:Uncharacterized protein n=1 Tax=Paenibacillus sambharensis TaxID=1803190 RepID=A0A2W1LAR7_9BACL|nr:hypothetical protein [Paenibacillus sambharensis]PZD95230.1 hypothetical protein DNH61_11765 [Paenibacillus sambharensis]